MLVYHLRISNTFGDLNHFAFLLNIMKLNDFFRLNSLNNRSFLGDEAHS